MQGNKRLLDAFASESGKGFCRDKYERSRQHHRVARITSPDLSRRR
jgi:hypothetical protein